MRLQLRDWALLILFLGFLGIFWLILENQKSQNLSHESHVMTSAIQQSQINQLKACIDEKVSPCDINTETFETAE